MSGTTNPASSFDVQGALDAGYAPAEVVQFLAGLGDKAPIDVEGARKAGYSNADIQAVKARSTTMPQGQNTPTAPGDISYVSALGHGIASAAHGFGRTVGLAFPETGAAIAGAAAEPHGYRPAGPDVAEGVCQGDYRRALGALPRALVEGAPDFVGNVAAGAAGGLAGPAGALGGHRRLQRLSGASLFQRSFPMS